MKWLIALVIVLGCAVAVALHGANDPGFVVLGRGPWSMETTLPVFFFLLLVFFFLLYGFSRFVTWLWQTPNRLQSGQQARQQEKTRLGLEQGCGLLAQAQWAKAEAQLVRGQPSALHYAGAAFAAQQQQNAAKRDEYITRAQENVAPEQALGLALYQAQLHIAEQQWRPALAVLKQAQESSPKHPEVLRLLVVVYQALANWEQIYPLLGELRKRKMLVGEQADAFEVQVVCGWLGQAAEQSSEALNNLWQRLSKAQRLQADILYTYARFMLKKNQHETVDALLREGLKQVWDKRLLALYQQVEIEPAKQLAYAESWMKKYEQDPDLLRLLGQLCIRNRVWGKAQQYLEASVARDENHPETYAALGTLMTNLGEHSQAASYYQQGLQRALNKPRTQ